ncbi:MAG: hypothetical protein JWQ71_4635 [Pedosphaera sp.]|nr:hypothetical protein [Pedosphaera sp.]
MADSLFIAILEYVAMDLVRAMGVECLAEHVHHRHGSGHDLVAGVEKRLFAVGNVFLQVR